MCKWTAFAIDSLEVVCEDSPRENVFLLRRERSNRQMPGITTPTTVGDARRVLELPIGLVKTLAEAAKTAVWIAERSGRVLVSNENAKQYLGAESIGEFSQLNVFRDVLKADPNH